METTARHPAPTQGWIVFGVVWVGQLISLIGSGLSGFALGVWYFQAEASVTQLALFSFFNVVPGILLSPFAGVLVDRWDRRRAMLLSDIGAGLCTVVIWLILMTTHSTGVRIEPWILYIPVGISSAFSAFRWPAYSASTTLLIPKQHLGRANGLIGAGQATAQIAAPALAGMLVITIGLYGVILIDLVTFAFAVITLLLVRFPKLEITTDVPEARSNLLQSATYGWKYIKQRPSLLGLLLFATAANFSLGFVMVLIIPLVLSFADATALGVVLSIAGLGMLAGSLTMSVWGGPQRLINGVVGFTLLAGVLLVLAGFPPSVGLAAGIAFLYLFSIPISSGCSQAIWQRKVAPDVQGRVFAVQRMIAMSSAPLSRLLVGPLVDNWFEPWLATDGPWASSIGQLIGTGPGRGTALLFVVLGLFNILVVVVALFSPRLMRLETDLPDAIDNLSVQTQHSKISRKGLPMKRLRKWLLRFALILVSILVIVVVSTLVIIRRAWPEVDGTLSVPGLTAQVQVIRDKWGVPHIYADNEHDLFFAQGYVHAQDRLWQMEMNRRASTGTLSQVAGKAGVSTDRAIRLLGIKSAAEQTWETLDADTRNLVEDYMDGVNAYIESHRDRLPLEYTVLGISPDTWTPIDVLSQANLLALSLGHNYRMEILRAQIIAHVGEEGAQDLFTPYAEGTPIMIPPEASNYSWLKDIDYTGLNELDRWVGDPTPGWGSNNWVVSGSRTATGKPLLENDTHLGTQMPSLWYENDLHGGRFNVTGFSLPGVPFIIVGHNQRIAWGETALGQDVQDYYIEKFDDPENPTQYEYQGQWYPLERRLETIQVRGSAPITFTLLTTQHGAVMNEFLQGRTTITAPLTLRWALRDGNRIALAAKLLNLASNWEEYRTALSYWDAPGLNMVYADVDGNIGYQAIGRTPIRVKNHQGIVPVTGWTGDYEWQGYIPFEEMPFSYNPPAGFLATANNRVTTDAYTYTLTYDWFPGYRAQRITELLATNDHVTLEDMKAIEAETYSYPAQALRPYLLAAVQPANEQETKALEIVKNWDLYFERDRAGASIYERWYVNLIQNTIADELGKDLSGRYLAGQYERHGNQHVPMMVDSVMPDLNNHWFDDTTTPERETRDDIIRRSFSEAVQWLSDNYGKDPQGWIWGRLHTLQFGHVTFGNVAPLNLIFNGPKISVPGDHFSVNSASFNWNAPFAVIHSVSQRMIVDLGAFENSVSIHTTGQSERLLHPHREDFVQLWANVQYHPMLSERANIEQNREATLVLTP
ncbi:Penicillin acylase 2 proenzyme [Thermoflexales bacterium]|nr:Penicillin acylase 2 proenzyme [Thermoflexales bacterium]